MITLAYQVVINAPVQSVWDIMLAPDTYSEWTRTFASEPFYRGEWKQGQKIDFIDPKKGGTRALLEKVTPCQEIFVRHIAVLDLEDKEDVSSEIAKQWIGTTEHYRLAEAEGVTTLDIVMETDKVFETMFAESWPGALQSLKALCEGR